MLKGKMLLDNNNSSSPNKQEKYNKIRVKYFSNLKLKVSFMNRF